MIRAIVLCALLAFASAGTDDRWAALRSGLESWAALSFDAQFAVNVGDASGTLFTWASVKLA